MPNDPRSKKANRSLHALAVSIAVIIGDDADLCRLVVLRHPINRYRPKLSLRYAARIVANELQRSPILCVHVPTGRNPAPTANRRILSASM